MRDRARGRGDRGRAERARAARGPDGALRDPGATRGGAGLGLLAAVGRDAVRDARAVRDVRGRDSAGARAARDLRRHGSEGRGGRQRARRAGRAAAEPPARGGGGAAGGRVGGAPARFLRIQTLALPIARPGVNSGPHGGVPEWLNGAVSKTVVGGFVHRGFESLPLRWLRAPWPLGQPAGRAARRWSSPVQTTSIIKD